MNGNTQKLIAYAALVFVAVVLLGVWGGFAFYGKTDVGAFISRLSDLLGIVIAAIAALGSVHIAASSRAGGVPTSKKPTQPTPAPTKVEQQ
ncbi:conserved protein of unknown function [Burkholderia multivorans]